MYIQYKNNKNHVFRGSEKSKMALTTTLINSHIIKLHKTHCHLTNKYQLTCNTIKNIHIFHNYIIKYRNKSLQNCGTISHKDFTNCWYLSYVSHPAVQNYTGDQFNNCRDSQTLTKGAFITLKHICRTPFTRSQHDQTVVMHVNYS